MSQIIIRGKDGNIGIALVVVLLAVMSGISLASVAFRDTHAFRNELDGLQQFHLLRSEVGRGRFVASHLESLQNPAAENPLPTRHVSVEFGSHRTVYHTRTSIRVIDTEFDDGFKIKTLITATRGADQYNPENESKVKRYGENRIESLQTLALFHYFSDIDRYIDDVPGGIVFWEEDIIYGRVHSNTDIYLRNNSWPQFHGLVTTAGMIRVSGGGTNYPKEDIFLGPPPSLIENYPRIAFEPTADLVRNRGHVMFGGTERDDAIAHVLVDGSSYELRLGEVVTENNPPEEWIEGYNQFTIYETFPPYGPVGDSSGVNLIPKTDTLWGEPQTGTVVNNSVFVPMELWISGDFLGRQTWASSHTIYLKGDLTYRNTPPGERPDGRDGQGNYIGGANPTDYLGIISEDCVYIQYGHWCPIDSMRVRPNTADIFMYGAYAAVGQGESDRPWDDGMIHFDYMYPKGSTPQQFNRGEEFTFIDLHLFSYPTTASEQWPPGLDYPWYNPLWPEPGAIFNVPRMPNFTINPHDAPVIVRDRGDIWLFGSFAQRRRGAVGVLSGGVIMRQWNIDGEINPNIMPTYGAVPPGRTGYGKRYHTDLRFETTGPPHYPVIRFEGYETQELMDLGFLTRRWIFKTPPTNF